MGESFEFEGTAYGNDYKLNTVTIGISYFTNESNYNNQIGNSVYLRYTNLSVSNKTISQIIKTGAGQYITGTNNAGTESVTLYTDKAGIYTVTMHGYSSEYGKDVKETVRIDVIKEKGAPVADLTVSPSQITLGGAFEYEGTAYGNDYVLNTVTIGFTYYSSEYNYSQNIATDTGYLRCTGLTAYEYDVYNKIQTGSNSYLTCTDETGTTTKQFY